MTVDNQKLNEAIEWAKVQSLFYSKEYEDRLLDERNARVCGHLKALIEAAQEYIRAAPDKVMIDKVELEKIKSVLEGYIGGAYGSNARWGLQILEAALKGEK